jgi:mRNA interferase HicA
MKHRDLLRHLETHGCELLREGGRHTIYVNRNNQATSAIPRHQEINNIVAKKICRDLGVPDPLAHS